MQNKRRAYHQSKDISDLVRLRSGTAASNSLPLHPPPGSPARDTEVVTTDGPRPAKRQRIADGKPSRASVRDRRPQGSKRDAGRSIQVVSSLFTSNPKAAVASKAATSSAETAAPSNAPLPEGAADFSALGLSDRISAHLVDKLRLQRPTAIQQKTIPALLTEDTDAFLQAETGSGKTLAYLLPIVQKLQTYFWMIKEAQSGDKVAHKSRESGLFAIILAPTRELCKQISTVLQALLHALPWIVAGTVSGGENKKSEKARVRKGLNVLVATPGRLVDHLQNTESLDISLVKWLVLDEGDRLMELGFEKDIQDIIEELDRRARRHLLPGLPDRRINILCSATMKTGAQKLGELSLKDAAHFTSPTEEITKAINGDVATATEATTFMAPAQLQQAYTIIPAKLRLVGLVAHLRQLLSRRTPNFKAIVFLSCADSVDFHFDLLARYVPDKDDPDRDDPDTQDESQKTNPPTTIDPNTTTSDCAALCTTASPSVTINRLHGSLLQTLRTSTLETFRSSPQPSILFCTDVASRGLDLPSITAVLEYDPAFSLEEHLHRVGRTARAGQAGQADIFLQPGCEERYIARLQSTTHSPLTSTDASTLLRRAFKSPAHGPEVDAEPKTSERHAWEARATDWQLGAERFVADGAHPGRLARARRAYVSHVRAYATHIGAERDCFDIKALHLGHLAKAFALRDRPGEMQGPGAGGVRRRKGGKAGKGEVMMRRRKGERAAEGGGGVDVGERMREKIRQQGNAMAEFNIA